MLFNRHDTRIIIVRSLFTIDFQKLENISDQDLLDIILYSASPEDDPNELYQEYQESFLEIIEIIQKLLNMKPTIDEIISKHLDNYTISRLNYTDRAIVRLATFELLATETPKEIIIDEAILITKEYSNLDDGLQSKFTNRLINDISEGIRHE